MRSYDHVLRQPRRGGPSRPPALRACPPSTVPEVEAEPELVVEDAGSGFCGAVVGFEAGGVVLEDRHGGRRLFPLLPAAFLLDGEVVTLCRPAAGQVRPARRRTASGSVAVDGVRARVAKASRIWVEGIHDAALVERIWGDDLRIEGVVVEPLDGVDALPGAVRSFGPGPGRRLGVLVDHLVPGSKESLVAARAASSRLSVAAVDDSYVLVTGHPYVDIWQAVKPERVGIREWPVIPPGQPWKEGVCRALGVSDPAEMWRRVLGSVRTFHDVQTPLIGAVERLIDFVATVDRPASG